MNGLQLFAFVALPIVVAVVGWIVAFMVAPIGHSGKAGEQALPEPHRHHA